MEARLADLEKRVGELESQATARSAFFSYLTRTGVGRGTVAGLLGVGVVVGGLAVRLYAATPPARPQMNLNVGSTVTAPLRVVDDKGKLLVKVDSQSDGPRLRLFDPTGKQIILTVSKEGKFSILRGGQKVFTVP
jgi:hypothetical protein